MSWPNVTQHFFSFWGCYAVAQLNLQLHQERKKVVWSNRETWKCSSESNSTHVMDLGHINVVLTEVVHLYVDRV